MGVCFLCIVCVIVCAHGMDMVPILVWCVSWGVTIYIKSMCFFHDVCMFYMVCMYVCWVLTEYLWFSTVCGLCICMCVICVYLHVCVICIYLHVWGLCISVICGRWMTLRDPVWSFTFTLYVLLPNSLFILCNQILKETHARRDAMIFWVTSTAGVRKRSPML